MTNKHPVTKNKALAVLDGPIQDVEWASIVDSIVDDLVGDDVPDKVIRATELMVCGWPIYKIAKELHVKPSVVKEWLSKYPRMAMAVSNGRKMLVAWRLNTMEQQFAMAVEKSGEILSLSLRDETVDSKLVSAIGLHARYVLGLFAGKEIDVNIHLRGEDQTLKAKEDALEYLATSIAAKREEEEPIEGVFVVEDITKESAPLLDHEGKSAYGDVGLTNINDDGMLCHICGDRTWSPVTHVVGKHKMKANEYESVFMLPMGSLKSVKKLSENLGENNGE